jgi:hypothetical protein
MSNIITEACERRDEGAEWHCERCWSKWPKSDDDAYRPNCCLQDAWNAEQKRRRASLDSQQEPAPQSVAQRSLCGDSRYGRG